MEEHKKIDSATDILYRMDNTINEVKISFPDFFPIGHIALYTFVINNFLFIANIQLFFFFLLGSRFLEMNHGINVP